MVELRIGGILADSERERMLRAIAELCAEIGFEEITAAQVAERAGSSEKAFSKMFGDTEECMLGAVNAITGQTLSEVSSTYSVDVSEWESGMRGVKAILELMAAHPSFAHLGYIGSRQMATKRVREVHKAAHQMLAVMIERLWEYSQIDRQPSHAASAALGGCEAVVRAEILAGRTEQLPRVLPDFVYAATVPFLGQEEAMRLARQGRELLAGSEWE